jgi:hypothetical protein
VNAALHRDGFVWLGRLSNLKVENQLLLIYGNGERPVNHSMSLEVERFTINYTAKVRGKNSKDDKWKAIDYNSEIMEPFDFDVDPKNYNSSMPPPHLNPPPRPNMTAIRNGESSAKIQCKVVRIKGIILLNFVLGF